MNPRYSRYFTYIKPIINNRQVKTYSSFVFSLITVTFFAVFAIKPTINTIISLRNSIQDQNEILNQLNQKTENLSLGKKNYESISSDTKVKLERLLPSDHNITTLIIGLSSLAKQYNASISAIQFQPIDLDLTPVTLSKNPKLKELSLTFNLQGTYEKLIPILSNITLFTRLLTIDTINLNKNEDGTLTLSIVTKAYYVR